MASDDEAVRALVIAYAERLDRGDFDGVAALFDGAVVRAARSGELRGAAEVRRMYDAVILYEDGTPRTQHVLSNLEVEVDAAAGTATSRCAFTVVQARPAGGVQPVLAGRYEDRFERVDGVWKFVERVIRPDLTGSLSHHMRG
ncbi:MAG TPA: nuclear transport factor 2 family protein [Acidimicrobiia bacterium]|nr:nuclear transport factor 2 family protein [Acidimicrobiia bacterium]